MPAPGKGWRGASARCRCCRGSAGNLFPLRHYFLIYVDQALNGYPMIYSWMNYVALLIFMMLPFLIAHRLKEALIYYKYLP